MKKFLTEIFIGKKCYAGPDIEANSLEEAEKIENEEYRGTYNVVGELAGELHINTDELENIKNIKFIEYGKK